MTVFILAVAAGFFNALMDTIEFHWGQCWLFDWLWEHWRGAYWWFMSQWSPTNNKWLHWIFGDGWHTAKLFMIVSILASIYFSAGTWWDVFYFMLGWGISFNLFLHVIFILPGHKKKKNAEGLPW